MPESVTLDRFDLALLAELQRDNQQPARRLAERIGLSESAVLRRLRRLRRDKVILADVSIVAPQALGLPLTMHVLVSLEREGLVELDDFTRRLRARPEVRQAWYVTGEADFVLRRLRRLRRDKVILADVALVAPAALGLPLTMHVLVSLEREGLVELDAFTRRLRARPEVRQAWYVTGEADFVLRLQLADMAAYEDFAREVFHGDRNVRAFHTIIAIRQVVGVADAAALPVGDD